MTFESLELYGFRCHYKLRVWSGSLQGTGNIGAEPNWLASSSLLREPLLSPTYPKYGYSNIWGEIHLLAKECKLKCLHATL